MVTVQVTPVQQTRIEETIETEAVLSPLQQSAIVPKISAPVSKFLVNRGSHVRRGQLLAVLENRDLQAAAQENRGALAQAEAAYATTTTADLPQEISKSELDVKAAQQLLDAQQKVYDSRKDLFAQGALPRKELDQAGVDLTQARNQYETAKRHLEAVRAVSERQTVKSATGQLESAKGKYQGAEAQLGYSDIRSPIDGVVTDRPLYPGEMATAGTPLIVVMNTSQVIAKAHIPERQAALLKPGDPATVSSAGDTDLVRGKVTLISPALDPNSTTVEVWIQCSNPDERLKPGTSVQVSLVVRTIPDALVIPDSALLTAPDGATTVMVAGSDGKAHQREVKVGIRQKGTVQVVEGLHVGDPVIASGAYGLPDNTVIKVEPAQNEGEKPDAEGQKAQP
ncbi:MAG: efflux RND transporter periplasmic adaptor subunit [Acidobacteriales bacterium]|nr:efflux RND transporter periplasmic adaptor subunit [Terriglobales bacterium]